MNSTEKYKSALWKGFTTAPAWENAKGKKGLHAKSGVGISLSSEARHFPEMEEKSMILQYAPTARAGSLTQGLLQ